MGRSGRSSASTSARAGPYGTEEVASGARVAVIRAGVSRRFFGSEEAVGKSVPIDGQNYRVVGVVTDVRHNFFYRERGMRVHADVWVPVTTAPPEVWRTYKLSGQFRAAVLARRPADMERIRAEIRRRAGTGGTSTR